MNSKIEIKHNKSQSLLLKYSNYKLPTKIYKNKQNKFQVYNLQKNNASITMRFKLKSS